MLRALAATSVLSISIAPVGAFLVLRRLALAGEAMAHAIVPGIVIGFVIAGLSVTTMIVGGLGAGITVAVLTSLLARFTIIREDAGLASLYLIALALGIFILSASGSAVPLKSFLFGSILGIDDETLILIGATATITLISFALILRPLTASTIDPVFYHSQTNRPGLVVQLFMFLVVLNLLGAFKALGHPYGGGPDDPARHRCPMLGFDVDRLPHPHVRLRFCQLLVRTDHFVLRPERPLRTRDRPGGRRIFRRQPVAGTARGGISETANLWAA